MPKKEFFQKILLLLAPKLRLSLLFPYAMIFGCMSAPQTMDRPPHRDTDSHKAKRQTTQGPSPSLERNGLTVILLNHLEIEATAESLNNVEISPSSNKKRSLSTLESQTHKGKKARSKEAANEIILSNVCRMFPQEARPQVLQFMELPNMLINLIKGADIPQDHIRYWEPLIADHIPELKGYLRAGKKEDDVPAALRPALTALLTKHMSTYQKWQKNEDMHIFFSTFLNTLKLAHERGTLTSALTLAHRWYLSQKYTPIQLLIFLGFPFVKADKEYEIGIDQINPNTANIDLQLIDYIEKIGSWPKDVPATHFLKLISNISADFLHLGRQRFEEQLAFKHKESNYSALFMSFWRELADTAHLSELGTHQQVALAPSSCPAPPEDDIDSE